MKKIDFSRLEELAKFVQTAPWENKSVYAAYMAQVYYYVRHSTRLLALAAARFTFEESAAHERFLEHITEEIRHENLAELDVKALGFKLNNISEMSSTTSFYLTQYQLVEHETPWSLMGYILTLEGLAVREGNSLYKKVTNLYGAKAGHFLKVHAAEDVEHVQNAMALIEQLPESIVYKIQRALDISSDVHITIIKDCIEWAKIEHKTTAA